MTASPSKVDAPDMPRKIDALEMPRETNASSALGANKLKSSSREQMGKLTPSPEPPTPEVDPTNAASRCEPRVRLTSLRLALESPQGGATSPQHPVPPPRKRKNSSGNQTGNETPATKKTKPLKSRKSLPHLDSSALLSESPRTFTPSLSCNTLLYESPVKYNPLWIDDETAPNGLNDVEEGKQDKSEVTTHLMCETANKTETKPGDDIQNYDRNGAAASDCSAIRLLRLNEKEKKFLRAKQSFENPLHRFAGGRLILKAGVLDKRCQRLPSSQARLFVLTDRRLVYVEKDVIKGAVPLTPGVHVTAKSEEKFCIVTPEREYKLCDPEGGAKDWVRCLQAVIRDVKDVDLYDNDFSPSKADRTSSKKWRKKPLRKSFPSNLSGSPLADVKTTPSAKPRPRMALFDLPRPKWRPTGSDGDDEPPLTEEKIIPTLESPFEPQITFRDARSIFSPPGLEHAPASCPPQAASRRVPPSIPPASDQLTAISDHLAKPEALYATSPYATSPYATARHTPRPRMGTRMMFPNSMILSYQGSPTATASTAAAASTNLNPGP